MQKIRIILYCSIITYVFSCSINKINLSQQLFQCTNCYDHIEYYFVNDSLLTYRRSGMDQVEIDALYKIKGNRIILNYKPKKSRIISSVPLSRSDKTKLVFVTKDSIPIPYVEVEFNTLRMKSDFNGTVLIKNQDLGSQINCIFPTYEELAIFPNKDFLGKEVTILLEERQVDLKNKVIKLNSLDKFTIEDLLFEKVND